MESASELAASLLEQPFAFGFLFLALSSFRHLEKKIDSSDE